jgi:DNA-binding GntR family transcriptional regulator
MVLEVDLHRTVAEQIYQALRNAILTGLLPPGHRLAEGSLSAQFNTSRAPLREAIRRLESEGLVITFPHRGASVVNFSEREIDELNSLATLISGFAARIAAESADDEGFQSLQEIVDAMRATPRNENQWLELRELDFRLHEKLVELAGHSRLLKLWFSLGSQFRLTFTTPITARTRPGHLPADMADSHQIIVDAVRSRDPDVAEAQVRSRDAEIKRQVSASRLAQAGDPATRTS